MSVSFWFQLMAICFLGAISPGPSLALVVSNTIVRGRAYGVVTSFGHGIGIGLWAFLTAGGIVKVIVEKSDALLALQLLGACLLGYIGFRTIMAGDWTLVQQKDPRSTRSKPLLRGASEGLLIALLNPKVALFFIAIFSHLVHSDSNRTEIVLMGVTAALIDAFWYILVASILSGPDLGKILEKRSKVIGMFSGAFLILVALYLLGGMVQRLL